MSNLNNKIFLLFGVITASIIASLFENQGGFLDSLVYYEQFQYIAKYGVIDSSISISEHTGKFEFGLLLIFYLQSFFFTTLDTFLFVNLFIINIILIIIYIVINRKILGYYDVSFFSVFILLLTYYTFSNYIYIWRSMYAFLFLSLGFVANNKKKQFFWVLIACLFHFSVIVFYLLFVISRKILFSKVYTVIASLIGSVITMLVFMLTPTVINYIAAGDGVKIFFSFNSDFYEVFRRFCISFSFLVILLLYRGKYNFEQIYYYALLLVLLSIFFIFNPQLSWRVFSLGAILGTIFILSTKPRLVIKMLLFLSMFPSLRILLLFYLGQFNAM